MNHSTGEVWVIVEIIIGESLDTYMYVLRDIHVCTYNHMKQ